MLGNVEKECFMDTIKQAMQKELKKADTGRKSYEKKLKKLPKGALRMKTIRGRQYGYIAHREGYKVKYDYVGKVSDDIKIKYGNAKQARADYRGKITAINARMRLISRMLAQQQVLADKSRVKTFEEIRDILSKHMEEIQKEYGVSKIGVFGSYARGEQCVNSDIDILVEYENPEKVGFAFFDLSDRLKHMLKVKKVDLATRDSLRPAMSKNILDEVIYI
jgi:predicted nucleotidyltransferase